MEPAKVRASLVPVSILCTAGVRRAELALERQAQRLGVRKAGGGWEQQSLSPDPACGQGVSDHQAGMLATAGPWEWAAAPFLQAPLQAMPLRLCGSPLGRAESVLMACPPPGPSDLFMGLLVLCSRSTYLTGHKATTLCTSWRSQGKMGCMLTGSPGALTALAWPRRVSQLTTGCDLSEWGQPRGRLSDSGQEAADIALQQPALPAALPVPVPTSYVLSPLPENQLSHVAPLPLAADEPW
jgi:hypothetical protein